MSAGGVAVAGKNLVQKRDARIGILNAAHKMMLISAPSAAAPPPRTALLEDDGRCDTAVAGARLGAAGIVVGALEAFRGDTPRLDDTAMLSCRFR